MAEGVKLDLGCGKNKKAGFIGVDNISFDGVDVVHDLRTQWPWEKESVEEVHCSHFLEHLTNAERVHFWNELYRVMKPGAKAQIIVPHWSSGRAYGDPTHCFADDTEILTEVGWKLLQNVSVGERVHSLNLETEQSSLEAVIDVRHLSYVGNLLHFKTDVMDMLVTPNHDMIWRSKDGNASYYRTKGVAAPRPRLRKSSAETFLGMGSHHPRRGTASFTWHDTIPKTFRFSDDEVSRGRLLRGDLPVEDFCELLGWFVSEGNVDLYGGHYRIDISQKRSANPEKYKRIAALCRRLGFVPQCKPDGVTINSKPLALYFKKLGLSGNKYIPKEVKDLGRPAIRRLLESAILGDGTQNGAGYTYATTSRQLADDIQEIAIKVGYRTCVGIENRIGLLNVVNGRTVTNRKNMHLVYLSEQRDLWYPIPKPTNYVGKIACVTIERNNTIFVRRNGRSLWSGNCWPPVVEFSFYYLDKGWREVNAPHCGLECDFQATWGYSVHPSWQVRSQESQMFALGHYREVAQDLICTVTKR